MSLHSTTDRFIEDLIKAAKESFARSPHRQPGEELHIQISGSSGHKLANHAGLGALAGGLLLPGIGVPIGAAVGADKGQRGSAALGSVLGAFGGAGLGAAGGAGLGALIGVLTRNPGLKPIALGADIGGGIGGVGGIAYGAQRGGHKDSLADKLGAARNEGARAAAARFGIKEAFLPPGILQKVLGTAGQLGQGLQTGAAHIAPSMPAGLGQRIVSGIGQFGSGMHQAAQPMISGLKTSGSKEAFIGPLLGSIAGPALARAGVGALAKGAGGAALGGMAGKVLPRIGGGMGGMAFDAASSMAGGALGDRLQSRGPMG